jgi:hypothetical protein
MNGFCGTGTLACDFPQLRIVDRRRPRLRTNMLLLAPATHELLRNMNGMDAPSCIYIRMR